MIETEVSFLEDLKVLKELFFDNQDFAGDRKLLFTGLEAVIDVSIGLIQDLKMGLNLADVFLSKV